VLLKLRGLASERLDPIGKGDARTRRDSRQVSKGPGGRTDRRMAMLVTVKVVSQRENGRQK